MTFEIPEDLRTVCTLCNGSGSLQAFDFRSAGEMDANDEPKMHAVTCRACRGKGWLWALDQEEMAQRIGALVAEVRRLEADVKIAEDAMRGL